MLLGTIVFVNAGRSLAIESTSDILSPDADRFVRPLGAVSADRQMDHRMVKRRRVYKNYRRPQALRPQPHRYRRRRGRLVTAYVAAASRQGDLVEANEMGATASTPAAFRPRR
jgi:hypothetical protein